MNPQETLILIKGEIKTEEIESLSFDNANSRCRVVYRNGKAYVSTTKWKILVELVRRLWDVTRTA